MGENDPRPSAGPGLNDRILFWASFLTLIAAGIGFSVRGAILKDWGQQFGFTQSELGSITGGGLLGFGLAIIFFSFCADLFGYGKLMLVAFVLHAASAVLTFAATPIYEAAGKGAAYQCLWWGMLLFALGNGTCEAVINPLTATLFPKNKTHWLNILHAGWPGGLILGALIVLGFGQVGQPIRWEIKLGVFLLPVLMYGLMMFNRPFPKSEAQQAGISISDMMGQVGLLGASVAVGLIGLLLSSWIPDLLNLVGVKDPKEYSWIGWVVAGALWLIFWLVSRFSFGSVIIAFMYLMHALVGYVELGTDSWITNITERVLDNQTLALLAFVWTNALMFILRFFAGPIVHKINPVGLLLVSALLGTAGLVLLGLPFTNTIVLWIVAVTIYGIGKTFYWPTLLGVISERFPKGGALALGISGGVGMLSAGLLGAPGIGYKQDYAAVSKLAEMTDTKGTDTHERYMALNDEGKPNKSGFPLVTKFAPDMAPEVAGLDNGKLKVFDDHSAKVDALAKKEKGQPFKQELLTTTLDADLATLKKNKDEGKKVEANLEKNLESTKRWWDQKGERNYSDDSKNLGPARLYGAKTALLYTAAVPAILALGFLLLMFYFSATGGYKQVHLSDEEQPMGEY